MEAVDALLRNASAILTSAELPVRTPDDETIMDFLAERDDFMAPLEDMAEAALGRPSTGAGDADFEKEMVRLMAAVQEQLRQAMLTPTSPALRFRGAR